MTLERLADLIASMIAEGVDPKATMVLSKDREGNGFSKLDDWSIGYYVPETTWSGEFVSIAEDDDVEDEGMTREEYEGWVKELPAVCLWPVN